MKTISTAPMPEAAIEQLESVAEALPDELRHLLFSLAASLREGDDIVAIGDDKTVTPQFAATQLGMSRTHLYKLLDKGVIPSHRVGRDRRIAGKDLLQFAARRDAERREFAERFAHHDETRTGAVEEIADLL
ncbi:helix-turn-helix domain-containing protein [Brachybacterium sp.]|uniref:helix-turn-helix domain-containing protein n=1 Tax=Brachybacterium sp. TaxID=1891286 RepID=UPI002ED095D1